MLFIELRFIVLFAIAFCVHWSLGSNRLRKLWLLGISYVVYGAFDWRYLLLILASTVIDWYAGRGAGPGQPHRKGWLMASLIGNLGLLGFFKYYNFFVESASDFLELIGLSVSDHTLNLILPVGISFYTFQTLSYTIDIYRGRLEPTEKFTDLALFVAFFPQLVAGPIVRARHFMPQLVDKRVFSQHVDLRYSLAIFFFGFVKKTCISDQFAPVIDGIFSNPASHDTLSVWLGTFLFSIQVYCDFSGYSDMAIGLGGLLGYKLPRNFLFPYFSRSFTSFGQRWHITLSAWFTDYLYIPLGGSRGTVARTLRNLMIIYVVSGLWHGAAWTFVAWGTALGVLSVLERVGFKHPLERAPAFVSFFWITFWWIHTATVFRSDDIGTSGLMFGRMYGFLATEGTLQSLSGWWWLGVVGWYFVHWVMYRGEVLERAAKAPAWLFAILFGAAWALSLPWVGAEYTPFIYFQF